MTGGGAGPGWPVMRDTIGANAWQLPAATRAVAGYVPPSPYQWGPAQWALFPRAAHVRISVYGAAPDPFGASVLDMERGAFSVADAPGFIKAREDFRPGTATGYLSEGLLDGLLAACAGLSYWVWVAWWLDGLPVPTAGQVAALAARCAAGGARLAAWQYRPGPVYDESVIIDPAWLAVHDPEVRA